MVGEPQPFSGLMGGDWTHSHKCPPPLPSFSAPGPPSAPVNLISSVNGTSVTLEWAPPLDPGGRSDITYNAVCRRCPWTLDHCETCGSGTRFVPQQTSLVQASLLVANLLAHMNYSFWIEAVNGVSDLSPEPRRAAVVNITTNQAGRQRPLSQLPQGGPLPSQASELGHGLAEALQAVPAFPGRVLLTRTQSCRPQESRPRPGSGRNPEAQRQASVPSQAWVPELSLPVSFLVQWE